ncbi:DUF1573 domain-containing protein, partial [Candidatus Woesearchaeota archaeon]
MRRGLMTAMFFILAAVVAACSSNTSAPRIELSADSFDLGDINPDNGIRTETFFVKNTGEMPLKIESVSTSCGCTEAEVESEEIAPGSQTKLTVSYDPSVHPGLTGRIKRIVYIKSNDPLNEEVELELTGNMLPSSTGENDSEEKEEGPEDHDEEYEGLLKDFEISPPALYEKIKEGENFKLLD